MLKKRILTAVGIFTLFFLSLLSLPPFWFAVLVSLVLLIGAWEWANLSGFISYPQRLIYCAGVALLTIGISQPMNLLTDTPDQEKFKQLLVLSGLWWAIALLWVQGYPSSAVLWGNRWVRALVGCLVLLPGGMALVYLHTLPQGAWLILLVVLTVAVADTGAYFTGKAFGKHKLAVEVSPGKSWEGVIGGFLGCLVLALLISLFFDMMTWAEWMMIILPAALVSVLGDLLESMIKRHRGLKDSGRILPGHGGILDRIDGLTASAPIFALSLIIIGWPQ